MGWPGKSQTARFAYRFPHVGALVVDGWTAFTLLERSHPSGDWISRAHVARLFAALIGGLVRARRPIAEPNGR